MSEREHGSLDALKVYLVGEPHFDKALKRVCETLNVDHAVYHQASQMSAGMAIPFVRVTYSADWIRRYMLQNYIETDPVLNLGLTARKPFFWSDLKREMVEKRSFFEEARAYGVGNCGYTYPIQDKAGRRALFTVNAEGDPEAFRERFEAIADEFAEISMIFHAKALAELGFDADITPLSPREIECLTWMARGKDAAGAAEILSISQHTVRDYLKSARAKLGCSTIAQAVFEATRLNLIKP